MGLRYEIQRRARAAVVPVICAGAIGYFGYHALEGERGVNAYSRLKFEIEETRQVLLGASNQRRQLESRVDLLRADGLDLDMLGEQARLTLGLIRPDEVVILLPRPDSSVAKRN